MRMAGVGESRFAGLFLWSSDREAEQTFQKPILLFDQGRKPVVDATEVVLQVVALLERGRERHLKSGEVLKQMRFAKIDFTESKRVTQMLF